MHYYLTKFSRRILRRLLHCYSGVSPFLRNNNYFQSTETRKTLCALKGAPDSAKFGLFETIPGMIKIEASYRSEKIRVVRR